MTNTDRRALMGAIAAAPVMLTAPAQAVPANIAALDEASLWEAGARSADPEFARLCADVILTQGRALAADRLYSDASERADAATPEFPPALKMPCVLRDLNTGAAKRTWTEQWRPEAAAPGLDTYARRYAALRGVPYGPAVGAELRAQFDAWHAQREEVRARYLVEEHAQACDEAWDEASNARWRALRYPARSRDVLLLKASLRRCEAINAEESDEVEPWSEIVADLNRVLAA